MSNILFQSINIQIYSGKGFQLNIKNLHINGEQ